MRHCSLFHLLLSLCIPMLFAVSNTAGQIAEDFSNSFVTGREYFTLRSGNAKLILQADKCGTQPAFIWMLFDANKPCQTLRKARAFNYTLGGACSASALEVMMKGVPFTALAHTTNLHWTYQDGIPSVEARWWAGGIRVTESFTALEGANTFVRKITLAGSNLAGPDTVRLRLSLPPGRYFARESMLLGIIENAAIGIAMAGQPGGFADAQQGCVTSLPLPITPGGEVTVTTLLTIRIPAAGYAYEHECGDDRPILPALLRPDTHAGSPIGLKAEYFNNIDFAGTPDRVRIDTNLCPYWGTGAPAEGVRPDSFSVRWTGYMIPSRSGRHRFSLAADERARLFVGDTLLIVNAGNSRNVRLMADMILQAGRSYPIKIEFAELLGWAGVRVRCAIPGPPPDEPAVEAGVTSIFAALSAMSASHLAKETERTNDYWKRTSSLVTPDPLVGRIYNNARFALPGMVGSEGRMDAGMFEYGDQWVRDGSIVALGLLHAGHFEAARAVLNFILTDLVTSQGNLMASGSFDNPDREEFDQMGELLHALKGYRDWTGDSLLISKHREKIITMIERPLQERFRDSTGMVHNRREYWERTFEDGYELSYQTYMASGLRNAADLSRHLGVPEKASFWRSQADRFQQAMLEHPSRSLVDGGHLIKRRNVDGMIADFIPGQTSDLKRDDPAATEAFHRLNPDASSVLPMLLKVVPPRSMLARKTMDKLEELWNARWETGGYERYHSSSQQDQPGPWCFSTAFIARAQHDAGLFDRSRRSLEWLLHVQGGNAGAWLEQIPVIRSQVPGAGIVPWASAEIIMFAVRHWLGVEFEADTMVIRPALFPGQGGCTADLRFRSSRITIQIDNAGPIRSALVGKQKVLPRRDGAIVIPVNALQGDLRIQINTR